MGKTPAKLDQHIAEVEIEMVLAREVGKLYRVVLGSTEVLFGSINVVRRNHGDWLALCKVTMLQSMEKKIAFGSGRSYAESVVNLNRTIAAGHWKEDRPWVARG